MLLEKIKNEFSICKVTALDQALYDQPFTFISRTDHELSVICPTPLVPAHTTIVENGWQCFRIAEDAAFEKYGMIAFLTKIIASEQTGVLVVATYDTDYLFVKNEKMESVSTSLIKNGCQFIE